MAQDYENDKVQDIGEIYKNISTIENLDDKLIMRLYENPEGIPLEDFKFKQAPMPNQYFILKGNSSSALAHYDPESELYQPGAETENLWHRSEKCRTDLCH